MVLHFSFATRFCDGLLFSLELNQAMYHIVLILYLNLKKKSITDHGSAFLMQHLIVSVGFQLSLQLDQAVYHVVLRAENWESMTYDSPHLPSNT